MPQGGPVPHLDGNPSQPDFQVGTGSGSHHDEPTTSMTGSQVFDLIVETTWLEDQNSTLGSQFKNPKSKHAPIVRFLDKEYSHC